MSKLDKKLKPFKEEFKAVMSKIIYDCINNHYDEDRFNSYWDEYMPSLSKFVKRGRKYIDRYGFREFAKWVRDVLNEIKLGDLMYDDLEDAVED